MFVCNEEFPTALERVLLASDGSGGAGAGVGRHRNGALSEWPFEEDGVPSEWPFEEDGVENLKLEIEPVLVESVCQVSMDRVKPAARKKRLRIVFTYDPVAGVVQTDEHRLKQILASLLINAVALAPEDGTVGLEVMGDAKQEAVHFTVWDTGVGLSEEELERLFEPFAGSQDGQSHYDGVGLGLTLVRYLADRLGGGVSAQSKAGEGSRFTVSLPWQPESEDQDLEETDAWVVDHTSERAVDRRQPAPVVLVAEDNEYTSETISDYLQAKGYQVILARDGVEAIAQTRREHPDVVLMDIQMPVLDGLQAIRCIRADDDVGEVPIIALTALALSGDRERCMTAGANAHMSKPVGMKNVIEVIETHLRRGGDSDI